MPEILVAILCVIVGMLAVGFVMAVVEVYRVTKQLHAAAEIADSALESERRADERSAEIAKIHQELLSRPVQVMLPPNAIDNLGNQIIRYLNDGPDVECPVHNPKKDIIN